MFIDLRNSMEIDQYDEDHLSRCEYLCRINADRCEIRSSYGRDILSQIQLAMHPCHSFNRSTFNGYPLCQQIEQIPMTTAEYFTRTDLLQRLVRMNEDSLHEINR